MISLESTEPTIAARVKEWHQGRIADWALAPDGVPYLSNVPGYSLEDVRYNWVGLWSPAQARQATKTVLGGLAGLGVWGAFTVFMLAAGGGVVFLMPLVFVAAIELRAVFRLVEM